MSKDQLRREAAMMNLDQLIEDREGFSVAPIDGDQQEVLLRYERLYTGLISDVLREACLLDQALPGYLIPLRKERTVAGFAFTVKSAPNVIIRGEMDTRTKMLSEMTEDAFIVWDASGDDRATMWGGVMTATAVRMGVRGACVDGGIRDTHQISETDFPVFYKYRSPNGSLGRCQITHYQIPILIGDVVIKPGDLIVGDIDGVVVVPRAMILSVLDRAENLKRGEDEIFDWVKAGDTLEEITEKGGYF